MKAYQTPVVDVIDWGKDVIRTDNILGTSGEGSIKWSQSWNTGDWATFPTSGASGGGQES